MAHREVASPNSAESGAQGQAFWPQPMGLWLQGRPHQPPWVLIPTVRAWQHLHGSTSAASRLAPSLRINRVFRLRPMGEVEAGACQRNGSVVIESNPADERQFERRPGKIHSETQTEKIQLNPFVSRQQKPEKPVN